MQNAITEPWTVKKKSVNNGSRYELLFFPVLPAYALRFVFSILPVALSAKYPLLRGIIKPQTTMNVAPPDNKTVIWCY